jgi:hypothetical protein
MRVRFTENRTTKATPSETFEAGQVYDLAPASAARWIARGVAVAVPDEPAPVAAPPVVEPVADVAIPDGWASQHHLARMALAARIAGARPANLTAADAVIAAEVERRANPVQMAV